VSLFRVRNLYFTIYH